MTKYTGPIKEVEVVEKVKVTQKIADAIESLRNEDVTNYGIIALTVEKTTNPHAEILRKWTYQEDAEKLLDALVIGYEIEPEESEFKAGDKVITKGGGEIVTLSNPMVNRAGWFLMDDHDKTRFIYTEDFRHATPEEIHWLETLGREKLQEFRKGDAVLDVDGSLTRLTTNLHISQAINWYRDRPEELAGIYPAESFKPFPTEPE